jgi:hypothetical protein
MKKINLITIITITIASFITACKKDDTTPKNAKQVLDFHWHSKVGSADASYGVQFTSTDGIKFKLSDWRYYVSNFVLIKEDGSEYPISDKVFLIDIANADYSLDSVPVGNYKGFKFTVGLDSTTNHKDPTLYAASNPLSLQSPSIHWSWNSGYIFMKIEGKYDSTVAQLGGTSINQPFFFHVGTDKLKQVIDYSNEAFSVVSGEDKELHIEMDFLKILNSVNLKTENATHTGDNLPLATKISNNWKTSFTLE